ncbi:MAG: hisA/hisF family protein [Planctomycetaceae bacterium]|nr:hisA/hisF family protein [Planctomycetaceae bacterium]
MQILPVLDLLNGVVVRGVAGRRDTYRPIESRICSSSEPLAIARAFRSHFGLERLYVADLDAILQQRPNLEIYRQLSRDGFSLLVDAGIHNLATAATVLEAGADSIIAGLESIPNPALLQALVAECGPGRVLFSLDLQDGRPLIGDGDWSGMPPLQIAQVAIQQGIERVIVLDLAQVGIAAGISTLDLCAAIRAQNPDLELITGGGIRNRNDLQLLANSRLDGVLIASALHNEQLKRDDLGCG